MKAAIKPVKIPELPHLDASYRVVSENDQIATNTMNATDDVRSFASKL